GSPSLFSLLSSVLTRPPPRSTLFPYTTLFRSALGAGLQFVAAEGVAGRYKLVDDRFELGAANVVVECGAQAGQLFRCGGVETSRSEEHTSELQSRENLVCRLLLEKKKRNKRNM